MSLLQALISLAFKLLRASFKHCFELPSSLPSASFRLHLNFLCLSLRFPWALPQNYLKLALCFLQASFRLPASFLEFPLQFLASCFKHASSFLHAPSRLPLSFFGACFELALGILPIEKLTTSKPLFFALHTQASKAQSHKTLVSCIACKTFRTSKP